jgi:DUF1009 family protein
VVAVSLKNLLKQCRAAAFVLEAGKTLMLDQARMLQLARQGKIVVLGRT